MANEKYLTAEQEAKFMEQLGANSQTSPEAKTPVEDNGGAAAVESAPATTEAEPAADPNAAILEELGAKSVEDLANQLKESMGQTKQYREMLSQLLAYQQALDNKAEVEPDDPLNTVKKAVREEMAPIYEKLQREAQNKIVQEAWGKDARNMPDLTDMMPEITAFIQEHPELAVANDGLRRAYDGVRSKNYRSEKQLLVYGVKDVLNEQMTSNLEYVFSTKFKLSVSNTKPGDKVTIFYHYIPERLTGLGDAPVFPESLVDPLLYISLAVARMWMSEKKFDYANQWLQQYYTLLNKLKSGMQSSINRRIPRRRFR